MKDFRNILFVLAALAVSGCSTTMPDGTRGAWHHDLDGDGVINPMDCCSNTPEGVAVDSNGCADADQDGVVDRKDACPNTPPGMKVKENGCAECGSLLASVQDIGFEFNKAEIQDNATATLAEVVNALKNTVTRVRIVGHTDNIGSDDQNLALSQSRAQAVEAYLISRGIPANSISAVEGKGESVPKSSNETKEGRAQNRRVEIITDCAGR